MQPQAVGFSRGQVFVVVNVQRPLPTRRPSTSCTHVLAARWVGGLVSYIIMFPSSLLVIAHPPMLCAVL